MLSKRKVVQMDNKELLKMLIHTEDSVMVEVNSKRGVTKKTENNMTLCIKEMCKRLGIEYEESDWIY